MQTASILRILGIFLMVFSFTMLTPILIDFIYVEQDWQPYMFAFIMTLATGFLLWFLFRNQRNELKVADGFMIVVLFWMVMSLFASIPFYMVQHFPNITFVDSLFEAVSGLTTTGATVMTDLDDMNKAIRFYRQQLHFLGGMGIIVLAVAVLPMMGVGGLQLYRAEIPGPVKESKLTPRIAETAKTLWLIYVILTIACIVSYYLAGMHWLDAIGEGFSTVATGGFTMHQSSFAYYNSLKIEAIAVFFMLLGSTSFSLHFVAFYRYRISHYWQDEEFRNYIKLLIFGAIIIYAGLLYHHVESESNLLFHAFFSVISLTSTTGFVTSHFYSWPTYIPFLIMIGALIGGCAGSTSGGIKVLRMLLLKKQVSRELKRLMHPQAVLEVKFGSLILPEYVLQAMWGFLAAFMILLMMLFVVLLADGLDFVTAFGAAAATLANAGASIGLVANDYQSLTTESKYLLMLAMFAGRLEIFTLLILFTPVFWRH